jgi:hypothetical protein
MQHVEKIFETWNIIAVPGRRSPAIPDASGGPDFTRLGEM